MEPLYEEIAYNSFSMWPILRKEVEGGQWCGGLLGSTWTYMVDHSYSSHWLLWLPHNIIIIIISQVALHNLL